MRSVRTVNRYISDDAGAVISDVIIEQALQVPDDVSDDDVIRAAIASADKRVAAISAEFGIRLRPVDDREGVFTEIENVEAVL
jgi:hypothetical protein